MALVGIHMTDVPAMDYQRHLFQERDLRTVMASIRADGIEFLRLAGRLDLSPDITVYGFGQVAEALDDLRGDRASGSLVIAVWFHPFPDGQRWRSRTSSPARGPVVVGSG